MKLLITTRPCETAAATSVAIDVTPPKRPGVDDSGLGITSDPKDLRKLLLAPRTHGTVIFGLKGGGAAGALEIRSR
jgi:hypothetical protein